jgi:hypothetical protein
MIGSKGNNSMIYGHAIATLALVEAYGLGGDASLERPAQRALDYLEFHRNPYSVWRYQPRDNDNDTSVTGWCVMAYRAARDFKLDIGKNALQLAPAWFDQMTDPVTGRTGYTERGGKSSRAAGDAATRFLRENSECMTAVALCCRIFLGQKPDSPELCQQADLLLATPPSDAADARDYCYWYWGSYAQYQMGGRYWSEWMARVAPPLLSTQRTDGNYAGSWNPDDVWGHEGGRVYATAICAMTLQASARYARLIR